MIIFVALPWSPLVCSVYLCFGLVLDVFCLFCFEKSETRTEDKYQGRKLLQIYNIWCTPTSSLHFTPSCSLSIWIRIFQGFKRLWTLTGHRTFFLWNFKTPLDSFVKSIITEIHFPIYLYMFKELFRFERNNVNN